MYLGPIEVTVYCQSEECAVREIEITLKPENEVEDAHIRRTAETFLCPKCAGGVKLHGIRPER